ncbi:GEVED domain-containing protein [Flavicella sp.]|uniref:GEVED domain-containing protein n=1 Tax=Flavicella sp. TaxID=2957742 RepID=UPI0030193AFB
MIIHKTFIGIFFFFAVCFNTVAQEYCTPEFIGSNKDYYISNITLKTIDNSSTNNADLYEYYDTITTSLERAITYSASVTYKAINYVDVTLKIWIDFNNDGVFDTTSEEIYSFNHNEINTGHFTKNFSFTVPNTATIATSRMRVSIRQNITNANPCDLGYQKGEVEDYNINIIETNQAPTANCIGDLDITLDVSGNATISPSDINNGSTDDYDADNLFLSIDKTQFNCDDVGIPSTVTLTVEDSQGLTSTCTTTVNVSKYTGDFIAPIIEPTTAYCSYTATIPVLNFQCRELIEATTTDDTYFSNTGTFTIDWHFDYGGTTVTSTETIIIETPITPSNILISDTTESTATIIWDANGASDFKIRHKPTTEDNWTESISSTNSISLTDLYDGIEYEIQIKVNVPCNDYSSSETFTTIEIEYCDSNLNSSGNSSYYITNTSIGSIDNDSDNSADEYTYYSGVSTDLTAGETFSGSIKYTRAGYGVTAIVVWIDFNNDGDFDDEGEKIYSKVIPGDSATQITIELTDILIPETAKEGKTRMRISISQNAALDSACNFNYREGEMEDYDIYIIPKNQSTFEAAMFTQIYHYSTTERWIEISNSSLEIIPENTLNLALYKNKTGSQSGITPDATYTVSSSIPVGNSVLINSSSSVLSNYQTNVLTDDLITDFDDENDILIISSKTDNTAWDNRFDIANIKNNTSTVRVDEITTYNSDIDSSEWVSFVDDNLDSYRDLANGGPERHPHAPLISEVDNADLNTNILLGSHFFNLTNRENNDWTNGLPDRSRAVVVSEDYSLVELLSARRLEISSSSKLTVTNSLLLVSDNLNINSGSEIRLAGTSQLIQTHTSEKNTSGIGKLYIDQKSNITSIYRYNYLSSPVNTIGASNYTIASVLKDGTEVTSANSTALDINFVGGNDGSATDPISIAEYWIYTYANGDGGLSNWLQKNSDKTIEQVHGFTLKGPGVAQNYTFVGTPKDGELTTTIGIYQTSLVGNPYTSAISANKFIEDNTNSIDGTLYFWEHVGVEDENSSDTSGHYYAGYIGGYGTRNISMGLAANLVESNDDEDPSTPSLGDGIYKTPKEYIAVGQGFFVSSVNGGTVTFNNSQREFIKLGDQSTFFKNKKTKKETSLSLDNDNSNLPIIKLGLNYINDEAINMHRQIGISFNENNSFAHDNGYDSVLFDLGSTDIYWKFPDNDRKYSISGVQQLHEDLEVPLVLVMGYTGDITITIDEWQAINRDVFIKDKLTNQTYKINDNKVTLFLNEDLYEDRFVLTFKLEDSLNNNSDLITEKLYIYYNSNKEKIVIDNINSTNIENVYLYNIVGSLIQTWNTFEDISKEELAISNLTSGIYIVKVNSNGKTIAKQILVP